ncbi:MAG: DsrE family protein [Gammaproteobacteria bacterium]|nr:DsrE family protein [Gammaproteobacteria bacterium]
MRVINRSVMFIAVLIMAASGASAQAETTNSAAFHPKRIVPIPEASPSHPFAEHHVVFHISADDELAQRLVLNNAVNLQNALGGPDKVEIEVVAYGPGLRLLFSENENAPRIQSMADNGIAFSACGNTMKKMGRTMENLNPVSQHVQAGVARLVELQEAGWSYIRP